MNAKDEVNFPFVLKLFVEVTDVLSSIPYLVYDEKFQRGGHEYMSQTLITYLFNIFSLFATHVKLPKAVSRVKHGGTMDLQCFRMPVSIHKTQALVHLSLTFSFYQSSHPITLHSLMDQLQVFVVITSPGMLFAKAPISFAFFWPKCFAKYKLCSDGSDMMVHTTHGGNKSGGGGGNYGHGGRGDYDSGGRGTSVGRNGGNGEDKRKRDGGSGAGDIASGSIINTTERNIRMPSGLKQKYCSHFVDTSKTCDFGSKCKHTHAHYPSGFDNVDLQPMLVLSRILED